MVEKLFSKVLFLKKITKNTFVYEHADTTRYYIRKGEIELDGSDLPPTSIRVVIETVE